jgi:hypothetical protein
MIPLSRTRCCAEAMKGPVAGIDGDPRSDLDFWNCIKASDRLRR